MIDRRKACFSFGALLIAAAATIPARAYGEDPDGMIGAPLGKVAKSNEFFIFFQLERVASATDASSANATDFRPSGDKFRNLVRVRVITDEDGVINSMSLVLLRAFIDDPAVTRFARDISKSFLIGVPPQADARQILGLVRDIWTRGESSMPELRGPNYTPPTGEPTPDYAVFTGSVEKPALHTLGRTRFEMGPTREEGAPALVITFARP
jgi:hypothetical protein